MSILGNNPGSDQANTKEQSRKRDNAAGTNNQPFYKLMSNELRQLYELKLLDAPAYVLLIVKCHGKPGWKWTFKVKDFCKEWRIPERTFYRAVSKLKTLGLLHWEAGDTITVWHGADIATNDMSTNTLSRVAVSLPSVAVPVPSVAVPMSRVAVSVPSVAEKTTETLVNTSVAKTPDYIQSYSDFLKTLSDSERENFEKFVTQEWKNTSGKEIISLERFLAKEEDLKNWQERFFKTTAGREVKKKAIATKYDWRNDPRFDDWIWKAFNSGYPWTQEDEAERDERYAFWEWAQDTNAYEGICLH